MKKCMKTILKGPSLFLSFCFMFLLFSQTIAAKAAQTTININDLSSWNNVTTYLDDSVTDAGGGGYELAKFYVANDANYMYYRWDVQMTDKVSDFKSTNLGVAVTATAGSNTPDGMVWLEYNSKGTLTAKIVKLTGTAAEVDLNSADVVKFNTGTPNALASVVIKVPFTAFASAGIGSIVNGKTVVPLWAQTNASQTPSSNAKDKIPNAGYFSYNTATGTGVIIGANLSSAKDILTFSINGQVGTVNSANHTVNVTMPAGTDLTNLKPTFTLSDKSKGALVGGVLQKSETTVQNFTNVLTYTVVAQDGTTQDWTVNIIAPYTITFDANGGKVSTSTQTKLLRSIYGKASEGTTAESLPVPVRTGYTFNGWYDGVGGTGNLITDSTTVATASNHTLHAKWTINSYIVTFRDYDGKKISTQSVNYGSSATAPADPGRAGYTFTGWDTSYSDISSELTVTAQYSANSYAVTFDPQGGEVSPGSKSITFDSAYGTLPVPTRAGYAFTGWYTGADGLGTKVIDTTLASTASNHTLYAKWVIPTITLSGKIENATTVKYTSLVNIPEGYDITIVETGFFIGKTSSASVPTLRQLVSLKTKYSFNVADSKYYVRLTACNTNSYKYWAVSYLTYKIGDQIYTIYSTVEKAI